MLKQRVVTAVVLFALLVGALAWSTVAFALLATAVVAAALGEWMQLVGWPRGQAVAGSVVFGAVLFVVALVLPEWIEQALLPLSVLATIVWAALAMLLLQSDAMSIRIARGAATVIAVLLTAAAWVALVHFLLEGVVPLLSVLFIVWLASAGEWRLRSAMLAGGILAMAALVMGIKLLVRRKRPSGEWGMLYRSTDPHSFPSGHAARVALLAVMAWGLGPAWFAVVLTLWAPLVALAREDGLTGVANRRTLDERLPQEMARARRQNYPLSVAMIDIDHFKRVNDTWGHPVGDTVLRHLAATLRRSVRGNEPLYRFGGEEFLVLAQCRTVKAAEKTAQRIVSAVRGAPAPLPDGKQLPLTVTAGLAEVADGETLAAAVERADAALYQGKQAGRDRWVIAAG